MINPCKTNVNCVPCADGNPLAGNSSEVPDVPGFTGSSFQSPLPPLGTVFFATGCVGVCVSTVSQEDADLCAAAQATQCVTNTWNNPVNGNPNPSPNPPGPPVTPPTGGTPFPGAYNTPQTGSAFCPDGTEFNWTCPAGLFYGLTQAIADAAALSYANQQAAILMTCLSDINDFVCADAPYSQTITATGMDANEGANNWEVVSGQLPAGITFNGNGTSATLSGTPTTPGYYSFTISVTGMDGGNVQKFYELTVGAITNANTLPGATVGVPYNYQLEAVGYNSPAFGFESGLQMFPPGMTLSATGLLSGTPTENGDFDITFTVDEAGDTDGSQQCTANGVLMVGGCKGVPVQTEYQTFNTFGGTPYFAVAYDPTLNLALVAQTDPARYIYTWNLATNTTTGISGTAENAGRAYMCFAASTGKFWVTGNTYISEFTPSPLAYSGRQLVLYSDTPAGLSYNPGNGLLYGTQAHKMWTADPVAATVAGSVTMPASISNVQTEAVADVANSRVYVGVEGNPYAGANLAVFDNSTNPNLLHLWAVPDSGSGSTCYSIVFCSSNGYVYMLTLDSGTSTYYVKVINPATGAIVASIPMPSQSGSPYTIKGAFDASSGNVIIPLNNGPTALGQAAVICTVTNTLAGYITPGASSFTGAAYAPGYGMVMVEGGGDRADLYVSS